MKQSLLFTLPGNETLGNSLATLLKADVGNAVVRHFPDGESYVKVLSNVYEREAIIVCSLHHPDDKILPLYFLAKTLNELRASGITLVAPYLSYMRQDKRFTDGECISADLFAKLLSGFVDKLITIDPHLHRKHSLEEIYPIHTSSIHASPAISKWIKNHVHKPVLIGPDKESEQWVSEAAAAADAPFIILEKVRLGDTEVAISEPHVKKYRTHTPVVLDDIISTAGTMAETVEQLVMAGMKPPVCIGIHAVMACGAFDKLEKAGAGKIITCNTIPHRSNLIKIDELLAKEIGRNCFV